MRVLSFIFFAGALVSATAASDASVARWLVKEATFAAISTTSAGHVGISEQGAVFGNGQDISDGVAGNSTGIIYLYLSALDPTGADLLANPRGSVTISEAQLNASGCGQTDPEDPTCAKLTLTGRISKVTGSVADLAKAAIQSRHPATKSWPTDHNFFYLQMSIEAIFFIDFYGGAKNISTVDYFAATPAAPPPSMKRKAAAPEGKILQSAKTLANFALSLGPNILRAQPNVAKVGGNRPPFFERAKVARWMVHQATWGVVSTTSVHLKGAAFGNVFSVADGVGLADKNSTGRLFFYLTTLDPTGQDLQKNPNCTFQISEASLPANLKKSVLCRGLDPEDPRCARITFSGAMVNLTKSEDIAVAKQSLFSRHPAMASWPTGHHFSFYELKFTSIYFLDMFGGQNTLEVQKYWDATP